MSLDFVYDALPMRVRFGVGTLSTLPDELDHLGISRALVLCSPGQDPLAETVAERIGGRSAGVLAAAVMHVPSDSVDHAVAAAEAAGADACVAVGGGSAIGLGKAIALRLGLPVVAVPTTYAGSEMTPVWGITTDGTKQTGRDASVLPRSVLYDPDLTTSLPTAMSVTSGFNAIAHAVEALYAPDANPIISLMAEEGVRALVASLPAIVQDGSDPDARSQAFYGSWLCGACLGATTMSLHHKLCHALGGSLNLPHAETHTVVLPHALAYNQPAAPEAKAALSRALSGAPDPAERLWQLAGELGAPRSLEELGMDEQDIDAVAEQVTTGSYGNPRPLSTEAVAGLVRAAWSGAAPSAAQS